jgi:hypothetical protein
LKIDAEIDLHGYTANEARQQMEGAWARRVWHGLTRVRVIHGSGAVLWEVVRSWAEEKGIPWTVEPRNPGVTILLPGTRSSASPAPPNRPLSALKDYTPRKPAPPPASKATAPPEDTPTPGTRASLSSAADPMAEEFERLAEEDRIQIFKRKQGFGALPPAASEAAPKHLPSLPPQEKDLMAEEFARLARTDSGALRRKKREPED